MSKSPPKEELEKIIEAILFVAEKPVSVKELATICQSMTMDVQRALLDLIEAYKNRGVSIIRKGNYFQMVSAPEFSEYVGRYLNIELRSELSGAALETLAIITYKQPITRHETEEIRGVNCDAILRSLQIRGLIAEVDRKDAPGRPILYGTTFEFLQHLGIESLDQLPKIKDEKDINAQHLDFSKDANKKDKQK